LRSARRARKSTLLRFNSRNGRRMKLRFWRVGCIGIYLYPFEDLTNCRVHPMFDLKPHDTICCAHTGLDFGKAQRPTPPLLGAAPLGQPTIIHDEPRRTGVRIGILNNPTTIWFSLYSCQPCCNELKSGVLR
jgi:hypothetical protein